MGHARSDLPANFQQPRELRLSSLARHHHALPPTSNLTPYPCPNPPWGVRPPNCCAFTQQSEMVPGASPHPGLRLDEANFGVVRSPSRERANHPIFVDQVRLPSTSLPHPDAFSAVDCRPLPLQPLPNHLCSNVGAPPSRSHHRRCPVSPSVAGPRTLRFGDASVPRRFCPHGPSHATFGTAPARSLCRSFRNGRSHSLRPSSHVLRAIFQANDP